MDSVSQLAMGAGVAHVVLGPVIGRRALVIGAVLGTVPDLDVIVRYDSAVDSFTRHRSWSHSLIVLTLAAPLFSTALRWFMQARTHAGRWLLAVWLALITHPLLDACTVYGTQLWWPLDRVPSAWGSMFIIDPLFTLPVLAGAWIAWRTTVPVRAWRASAVGLLVGGAYIAWSMVAQQQARAVAVADLAARDIEHRAVLVAPFPFTLLWRYVVLTDDGYREGYHSLLDRSTAITWRTYAKGDDLAGRLDDASDAGRLRWFTPRFRPLRGPRGAAGGLRSAHGRGRVLCVRIHAGPDVRRRAG